MTVTPCDFPRASVLDRDWVEQSCFRDAYRTPLGDRAAEVTDVFQAVFGHHPAWAKGLLIIRNGLVRRLGLEAPTVSEILRPNAQDAYAVGDTIGVWPIFALTPTELVAGRNNSHLDFRVSVLKELQGGATTVVISTVCDVHNAFGRAYILAIAPFHKWGVQHLMRQAVRAGRL